MCVGLAGLCARLGWGAVAECLLVLLLVGRYSQSGNCWCRCISRVPDEHLPELDFLLLILPGHSAFLQLVGPHRVVGPHCLPTIQLCIVMSMHEGQLFQPLGHPFPDGFRHVRLLGGQLTVSPGSCFSQHRKGVFCKITKIFNLYQKCVKWQLNCIV